MARLPREPSPGLLICMAMVYDPDFSNMEKPGLSEQPDSRERLLGLLGETYALILALEGQAGKDVINMPYRLRISSARTLMAYWSMRGMPLNEVKANHFMDEMTGRGFWSPAHEAEFSTILKPLEL